MRRNVTGEDGGEYDEQQSSQISPDGATIRYEIVSCGEELVCEGHQCGQFVLRQARRDGLGGQLGAVVKIGGDPGVYQSSGSVHDRDIASWAWLAF